MCVIGTRSSVTGSLMLQCTISSVDPRADLSSVFSGSKGEQFRSCAVEPHKMLVIA